MIIIYNTFWMKVALSGVYSVENNRILSEKYSLRTTFVDSPTHRIYRD